MKILTLSGFVFLFMQESDFISDIKGRTWAEGDGHIWA
jgi:hypothetical protein